MSEFQDLHQVTGRVINKGGQDYRYFGGTAYLGLLTNPGYIALYKKGIDIYGLNNGTSRSNNVQLGIYNEAENFMAARFGFEAAALFSSGYLAAQAAVGALLEGKMVFYAPDSHPALWTLHHKAEQGEFEAWQDRTIEYINRSDESDFVIVSNALDNLTPRLYDFSVFASRCGKNKKLLFILDDSHGIGILKRDAVSVDLDFVSDYPNIEVVLVASLAKGLGVDAGIVLGKNKYIELIKKHPIFRGASPASPASAYALINGSSFYYEAFERLQKNLLNFSSMLGDNSRLSSIANFPVFTSQNPHLYRYFLNNRILISSFPYPLPNSSLLNRIVISSLHELEDLRYLSDVYLLKT